MVQGNLCRPLARVIQFGNIGVIMSSREERGLFTDFIVKDMSASCYHAYMDGLKEMNHIFTEFCVKTDASNFIINAFDWNDTPAGDSPWSEMHYMWKKKLHNYYLPNNLVHKASGCSSIW